MDRGVSWFTLILPGRWSPEESVEKMDACVRS